MTDKQIIIDGVDVSGCEHYDEVCLGNHHYKWCKDNDNYYYKQLKRAEQRIVELNKTIKAKEQECERLKLDLIEAKAHGDYLNNLALSETLNLVSGQLDQFKAENEELTTINTRLLGRLEVDGTDTSLVFNLDKELRQKEKEFYTAIQKVVKLKQTLTEIKEICNNNDELKGDFNLVDCDKYKLGKYNLANKILQKISECEVK